MAPHANARDRWQQAVNLLDLGEQHLPTDWDLFKALLISAIVLGDSVRNLIHAQDARAPGFRSWEESLEQQWPALKFFREERNFAMHQGPSRVHGFGYRYARSRFHLIVRRETPLSTLALTPAESSNRETYFDDPAWQEEPAREYVTDYLGDLDAVIKDAEARF
jgi:hypothetical protein